MRIYVTDKCNSLGDTESSQLAAVYILNSSEDIPTSYISYGKGVLEAQSFSTFNKISVFEDRLYLFTKSHYKLWVNPWVNRYDHVDEYCSNLMSLKEWLNNGEAVFEFKFLAVYINSKSSSIIFYLPPSCYLKADSGNSTVIIRQSLPSNVIC